MASGQLPRLGWQPPGLATSQRCKHEMCTQGRSHCTKHQSRCKTYILNCYRTTMPCYMSSQGEGARKMRCQRHAEAWWQDGEQPQWDRKLACWDCKLARWDRKSSGTKRADTGWNLACENSCEMLVNSQIYGPNLGRQTAGLGRQSAGGQLPVA